MTPFTHFMQTYAPTLNLDGWRDYSPLAMAAMILSWVSGLTLLYELLFWRRKATQSARRHQRNIQKARQLLTHLNTFQGPGQEGRLVNYLRKIDPYVFEELLLEGFERQGFRIVRNSRYSGDGGIDGTIYAPSGDCYLIQAKRYRGVISRQHLLDFGQLIGKSSTSVNRVVGGYFIHTGRTPQGLFAVARSLQITILSGHPLLAFLFPDLNHAGVTSGQRSIRPDLSSDTPPAKNSYR